jgi:hypothetical protein
MLPDSSLVFGSFSLQPCVTAADSLGPGVANATEHKRVLKPDYLAFEASAAIRWCEKNRSGAKRAVLKDDKFAGPDPVFFKIRYASTLPFGGIPSPDAARFNQDRR